MPNLSDIANGLFNRPATPPTGTAPRPQGPGFQGNPVQSTQAQYPVAPAIQKQAKPSEINMSGMKYHAFNLDTLNLNITNRKGFDGIKPDMMIWNVYQYNVTDLKANASEKELSDFVGWSLQDIGVKDVSIDFHANQSVTISGKYPVMGIPLPFSADISISLTPDKKILLNIDDFKTGFSFPSKMRDTLIGLLVDDGSNDNQPPTGLGDAFSFSDAMQRVGDNQILIDFSRMNVPLDIPINHLQTHEYGINLEGGSKR